MFKAVTIIGTLQTEVMESLESRGTLLLEVNFIQNGWQGIAKVEFDGRGVLEGGDRVDGFEETSVTPQFRLRDDRNRDPLAISYNVKLLRNSILQIDFGEIGPLGSAGEGEGSDLQGFKEKIAALNQDNRDLQAKVTSTENRLTQIVQDCDDRINDKNKTIEDLRGELNARENAVSGVASQEIARLRSDLVGKEVALARISAEKDVTVNERLAAVKERDDLKGALKEIREADSASPLITDLAGSVAKSLGDASKASDDTRGFVVADAKVTLRGYLADGGQRFKPLDAAELSRTNASAASEISFNLKPTSAQTVTAQQMPDLIGLTPASARRILRPFGNQIQLIEAAGKPAGGIVAQSPRAGQTLAENGLIRLTVATGPTEES